MLKSNYLTNRSTSVSNGAYIYFKENLLTRNVSLRKKQQQTVAWNQSFVVSWPKTTKTHRGEMECVSVMCARVTVLCVRARVYVHLCDERVRNCVCARERERERTWILYFTRIVFREKERIWTLYFTRIVFRERNINRNWDGERNRDR